MKKNLVILFSIMLAILLVTNCKKQENNSPVINNFELGSGHGDRRNDGSAYLGRDIHIAGEIVAYNKICSITVSISSDEEGAWNKVFTFDAYNGQLNASYHEHVDIPENVKIGVYDFVFKVLDKKGFSTVLNKKLYIKERPTRPTKQ